jgi:hypothetical protein
MNGNPYPPPAALTTVERRLAEFRVKPWKEQPADGEVELVESLGWDPCDFNDELVRKYGSAKVHENELDVTPR